MNRFRFTNMGLAALLLLFAFGIAGYNKYIYSTMLSAYTISLHEITAQTGYSIETKLLEDLKALETLGNTIASTPHITDITLEDIRRLNDKTVFDHITIADLNGKSRYASGHVVDLTQRPYWSRAVKGDVFITEPLRSYIENSEIIVLVAPIMFEGKIVGVISGSYHTDTLSKFFLASFNGLGHGILHTEQGDVVAIQSTEAKDNIKNFLAYLRDNKVEGGEQTIERMHQSFLSKNSHDTMHYTLGGRKYITHFYKTKINDWIVATTLPDAVISSKAHAFSTVTALLSGVFIVCLSAMGWHLFSVQRVHLKEMEKHNTQLKELNRTDFLTKIPNRSALQEHFDILLQKKHEEGSAITLMLFDFDHFKKFNDTYGHHGGDIALVTIAQTIKQSLGQDCSILARIGGEEFCVLFEGKSPAEICAIAQRVLAAVRSKNIVLEDGSIAHMTISMGSYQRRKQEESQQDLYSKADIALYAAKTQGRDRYMAYGDLDQDA